MRNGKLGMRLLKKSLPEPKAHPSAKKKKKKKKKILMKTKKKTKKKKQWSEKNIPISIPVFEGVKVSSKLL